MTNNEVNKIIAEFMGSWRAKFAEDLKMNHRNTPHEYTQSLDSLVPVWERLPCSISIYHHLNGKYSVVTVTPFHTQLTQQDEKVSVTAAHATAKAILALKDKV